MRACDVGTVDIACYSVQISFENVGCFSAILPSIIPEGNPGADDAVRHPTAAAAMIAV